MNLIQRISAASTKLNQKLKRIGRKKNQPKRDSFNYPLLMGYGGQYLRNQRVRPNTLNLRNFAQTPYVRKAINAIKDPIMLNRWEIKPIDGVKINSEIQRQIDIASQCFAHPNTDNSFGELIGLVIEDLLVFGGGCIEHQISGNMIRPIWMWPVDAQSIYVYPGWSGDSHEARYFQMVGFNGIGLSIDQGIDMRNDELIYMRANPNNGTPYGFGPVQTAFDTISRLLGTEEYAGNLASNAQPENLIYVGDCDTAALNAFRAYWTNDIEGQGKSPIVGGKASPTVAKLHSGNDESLYLKYQEILIREIAAAFNLTPANLGLERDVNRSTAEVGETRDWNLAIRPVAIKIQEHLTTEVLHSKLGWYQIQFGYKGLDKEDELINAQIYEKRYKNNMITPNEERARLGWDVTKGQWGNLLFADTQIAMEAARGSQVVDDDALRNETDRQVQVRAKIQKDVKGIGKAA